MKADYLHKCMVYVDGGMDFPIAFRKSVEQNRFFKENEKARLITFGDTLGTSSAETQLDIIGYYKEIFEEKLKESRSEFTNKAQSGLYACTFIGLGLFILLL